MSQIQLNAVEMTFGSKSGPVRKVINLFLGIVFAMAKRTALMERMKMRNFAMETRHSSSKL